MPLSVSISSVSALLTHARSELTPYVEDWTHIKCVSLPVDGEPDLLVVTIPSGITPPPLSQLSFEGHTFSLSYKNSDTTAHHIP